MDLSAHAKPFSHQTESPIGVLVIHGFTSTTSSVLPLARAFAGQGYNVELPSLSGHGQTVARANRTKYTDWLADVEAAYATLKQRCPTVFATGLSMGGALALYLAEKHPELTGLMLVNHAVWLKPNLSLTLVPVLKYVLPSVPAIAGDLKDPAAIEIAYEKTPVRAVHELVKMLALIKADLAVVAQPVLIFKSTEDHVLPLETGQYTMDHISSEDKTLIMLGNSYHVATLDFDKDLIAARSLEFIDRLTAPS